MIERILLDSLCLSRWNILVSFTWLQTPMTMTPAHLPLPLVYGQGPPGRWPLLPYVVLYELRSELWIPSITFICGTDSPVSMASSTMQRPRSSSTSHGTRFSWGERPARCRQESQPLATVRTSAWGGGESCLTDGHDVPRNNVIAGNRPPLSAAVDLGI